jgi:hypothetical protein
MVINHMKARPQGSATSGSTSTAKQASFDDLAADCPDLEQWPRSWRAEERDVPPGKKIVEYFTPFLRHLLNLNLLHPAQTSRQPLDARR